jgi:hypothetical protein
MKEFNFPKLIAYYDKILARCIKFGGRDWRYEMYEVRRDHVAALSVKPELTRNDCQYLEARSAVAGAF